MQNRRKTIIVNKEFQYQYSVMVAALCVLLVNAFIIFEMLFGRGLVDLSNGMIMGIAAVEILVVGGTWWATLVTTYRIAGPVYVFTREISRLAEGDLTARAALRTGDMFQDEARRINDSIAALCGRLDNIKTLAGQLENLEGSEKEAIQSRLLEEIASFKTEA